MSTYNTQNYTAHGGCETVINGKLTINGTLILNEGAVVEGARVAENQAASNATTVVALKDDLNALLTKLKAAGFMTADEPAPDNGDGNDQGDQS